MKMIARMFCAVALVLGAVSLTGCDKPAGDAKGTNTTAKAAADAKAAVKDAKDAAKDAKAAAKDIKDAAKK